MKIIILLRILWTAGAQRIAIEEAKTLQNLGHEVMIVFLRGTENGFQYAPLLKGVNYEIMSNGKYSKFSTFLNNSLTGFFSPDRVGEGRVDLNLIRSFPKYIKNYAADEIICHDPWAGLAGFYAKKKLGTNYSVFIHERISKFKVPILGFMAQNYERKVLKNAKRVFGISEKVAATVRDAYGINAIANFPGFNIKEFNDFDQKDDQIITLSMWDRKRKVELYLEIARLLPDFKFLILGNWRDANYFKEINERVDIPENLSFVKNIPEEQLKDIFHKTKFSIRFGFGEYGIGTSVMESISYSVPPIINSDLGTSDLITNYTPELIVNEIDPRNIADLIRNLNKKETFEKLQSKLIKMSTENSWQSHSLKLIENSKNTIKS